MKLHHHMISPILFCLLCACTNLHQMPSEVSAPLGAPRPAITSGNLQSGSITVQSDDDTTSEVPAVNAAARHYVQTETALQSADIEVQKIQGDYARVMVIPRGTITDNAVLILRKSPDNSWRGVVLDGGLDPEDYDRLEIPHNIRPE